MLDLAFLDDDPHRNGIKPAFGENGLDALNNMFPRLERIAGRTFMIVVLRVKLIAKNREEFRKPEKAAVSFLFL
jgi:hypothetical protein